MRMQSGAQDIFGNVSEGVPSPLVPHVHPYPTRFHGAIFNQPQFGLPYRGNPYGVAPYAGFGDVVYDQTKGAIQTAIDVDTKIGASALPHSVDDLTAIWIAGDPNALAATVTDLQRTFYLNTANAFGSRLGQVTHPVPVVDAKPPPSPGFTIPKWWGVLSTASMAASAYHGYKRHDSIGWALWWGLMGSLFPVITPVIAVAEGYGKPKGKEK